MIHDVYMFSYDFGYFASFDETPKQKTCSPIAIGKQVFRLAKNHCFALAVFRILSNPSPASRIKSAKRYFTPVQLFLAFADSQSSANAANDFTPTFKPLSST